MSKRTLHIGSLTLGGGAPVRVESMLSVPLTDLKGCLAQIESLHRHGAELLRVAFPQAELAEQLGELIHLSPLPLMADIHFDPKLAMKAIEAGIPAIRINPGNMGDPSRLKSLIDLTIERNTVVRIGANGGSISSKQLLAAGGDRALALADAVSAQVDTLLSLGQERLIISAKCTDLREGLRANNILYNRYSDFPFHIGITEAGWGVDGLVKSAAGIGGLLLNGIGDTLRVSLSQSVEDEVDAGYSLLRALDLRHRGGRLISCPTCGRKQLDTLQLVPLVQPLLSQLPDGFTLAVMGCEVNGPGEAKDADLGVAGSAAGLSLFKNGKVIAQCNGDNLLETLLEQAKIISCAKTDE